MNFNLLVKRLSSNATLPTRASPLSAGYDLYSATDVVVPARGRVLVPTDLSITVPVHTYGRVAPRSGLALKNGLDVGAGVVDSDYTGPVGVVLFNHTDTDYQVKKGDRCAQFIVECIMMLDVKEVDNLETTERGNGGFGSSGN